MEVDRTYVLFGFAWLLFGMAFGIYMGITAQENLTNTHAHANLVGFVLSALFGLLHRSWPTMGASRVAGIQLWVYQIGAVLLVSGKYVVDTGGGEGLVIVGSLVTLTGTALMAWLFLTHAKH
ncbi:hypothetical protein [Pseudogemmobacter sp. W21_MBD1_M6]|uniref:hypothetical protein n=1 Tax=Pseudogemmobacter sp. W21_MBD1_M6 TaxID=3240271 RepID=UPI003F9D1E29